MLSVPKYVQFVADPRFEEVKAYVRSGVFGPYNYEELMGSLEGNEGYGRADYFLVGKDFPTYLECQEEVDKAYRDQKVSIIKELYIEHSNISRTSLTPIISLKPLFLTAAINHAMVSSSAFMKNNSILVKLVIVILNICEKILNVTHYGRKGVFYCV